MLNGYLTTLPTDCLLSAGVLFCDRAGTYVPIGVTEGAPDFDGGSDQADVMFDNRPPSRLKGLTRVVGFQSVFKGTLKELGSSASGNQVATLEAGETEATSSGVTTITPKRTALFFADGDYITDFRWIFERASGGYACIYAPLAIVRKYTAKGVDKKEGQISFEIEAVGDPVNDLGMAPYTIELRAALPTFIPRTAGALVSAFNSLGPAQIDALYIRGINQTITPNGASATGYYCSFWDDAVTGSVIAPSGKQWRPTSGFASGAPCTINGDMCGEGVEIPASAALGNTVIDSTTLTAIGLGTSLYNGLLSDRSKGREFLFVGKLSAPQTYLLVGENDGTGLRYQGQDQLKQYHVGGFGGMPTNGLVPHSVYTGSWLETGSPIVFRDPGVNKRIVRWMVGRDLVAASTPYEYQWNDLSVGAQRRLRLFPASVYSESAPTASANATPCIGITHGRVNAAQRKLWNDWVAIQSWAAGLWTDLRPYMAIQGGDSYDEPVQAPDLVNGIFGAGSPAFPSAAVLAEWATTQPWGFDTATGLARAAMDPVIYNYPVLQWTAEDIDTSARTLYGWMWSEWQNLANGANDEATNYYMVDHLRSISSKFNVAMFESTRGNNGGSGENNALNLALEAHVVPNGHALSLSKLWRMTPNDVFHFGATEQPNKNSVAFWLSSDTSQDITQHPQTLAQQFWNAERRLQLMRLLGVDVSAMTSWVQPSVDQVTLNAAGTSTPTWTAKNVDLTTITKTLAFSSLRNYIATVNASTGLITAVQGGSALIQAKTTDNAIGICVVTVNPPAASGFVNLTDTFGGSNGSLVGNANTGQPVAMKIGTWKVDGSNHMYLDTPQPGFETFNVLLRDTGLINGTFKVQINTAINDDLRFYFRMTDLCNGWCLQHGGNGTWFLFKLENDIFCVRHPEISIRAPANGDFIEVVTSGTSITVNLRDSSLSLLGTKAITDSWNNVAGARFAGPGMGWLSTTPKFANFTAA